MISGLSHLDARVSGNEDYPYTRAVEKNCPKCGFYLREFLMKLMEKTGYIPAEERFFCSVCLTTRKICSAGYGKITAVCSGCEHPIIESWADMVTFLATA